jgi:uncharacterized protein YjbI with pentapeptide repeats
MKAFTWWRKRKGGRERQADTGDAETARGRLIAQMGSQVKDLAAAAVEELRREGWLDDGSLRAAHLTRANLEGATLSWANLERARLEEANLSGANLLGADLRRADLRRANLSGAELTVADLRGAILAEADLSGADLSGANLAEADLRWADLRGTGLGGASLVEVQVTVEQLAQARSLEGATLPDGTRFD